MHPEIEEIEKRLIALEAQHEKSWLSKNWFSIFSLLVLMMGMAVSWGNVKADVGHLANQQEITNARLMQDEAIIRSHHDDTERHIDRARWETLSGQISKLQESSMMIMQQMARIERNR